MTRLEELEAQRRRSRFGIVPTLPPTDEPASRTTASTWREDARFAASCEATAALVRDCLEKYVAKLVAERPQGPRRPA